MGERARLDANGSSVSIGFDGYRTEGADNDWDANWLLVSLEASDGDDAWTASAPALLTWEVHEIVAWLRDVAGGVDEGRGFSGLDGSLQLEAIEREGRIELTVILSGALLSEAVGTGERSVSFLVGSGDLTALSDRLLEAVAAYPVRAVESDGYASKLLGTDG